MPQGLRDPYEEIYEMRGEAVRILQHFTKALDIAQRARMAHVFNALIRKSQQNPASTPVFQVSDDDNILVFADNFALAQRHDGDHAADMRHALTRGLRAAEKTLMQLHEMLENPAAPGPDQVTAGDRLLARLKLDTAKAEEDAAIAIDGNRKKALRTRAHILNILHPELS